MSRRCELTGKGVLVGNNVSHANNKTKRRYLPNLQNVRIYSETLGRFFSLRVCVNAIRSVDKNGGLDNFILKVKEDGLSINAKKIRKTIKDAKAVSNAPASEQAVA